MISIKHSFFVVYLKKIAPHSSFDVHMNGQSGSGSGTPLQLPLPLWPFIWTSKLECGAIFFKSLCWYPFTASSFCFHENLLLSLLALPDSAFASTSLLKNKKFEKIVLFWDIILFLWIFACVIKLLRAFAKAKENKNKNFFLNCWCWKTEIFKSCWN